jgi:hypothetical protein
VVNPLNEIPPVDPIQRIHDFARDLAYGVAKGLWSTRFNMRIEGTATNVLLWEIQAEDYRDVEQLYSKWDRPLPSPHTLLSFGYLQLLGTSRSQYVLTEKAFHLLNLPDSPPTVFISYKRNQSSALALLVESRLKNAGNPNPFVDKNLVAGDEWHGELEKRIRASKYFICLVGTLTLESEMVHKEIAWAVDARCTIISMWHGCKVNDGCPEALRTRHVIEVTGESALEYENAIIQLLNSMGYSTY